MIVSAIAAVAENGTIGRDGDLPWHLPDDLNYFQRTTKGRYVITGRKNYESIPPKYRPLKGRTNIVVTRNPAYEAPGALVKPSLESALASARSAGEEEVFIIGGGEIYKQLLSATDRIYLTEIQKDVEGDTKFPEFNEDEFEETARSHRDHPIPFDFVTYERR